MINFDKNIVVSFISLSAITFLYTNFVSWCVENSTLQKYDNLNKKYLFVQFYRVFSKVNAVRSQLNWFQYKLLIRIGDEEKREFYIFPSKEDLLDRKQ